MKAVLVIDKPECCVNCDLCVHEEHNYDEEYWDDYYRCIIANKDCGECYDDLLQRQEWCPLKPLPRKLDTSGWYKKFSGKVTEREAKGYGYNACLDEILGEDA